jgi:hypothetical protein
LREKVWDLTTKFSSENGDRVSCREKMTDSTHTNNKNEV